MMEQMAVCEYCGTEIPHISASWTDDGSSYCEGCHPRYAQSRIAELEAEVDRLQGELKLTRDKLQEEGNRVNALGMSIAGFTAELEIETDTAWNDAVEEAAGMVDTLAGCDDTIRWAVQAIRTLKRGEPV